MEDKRTYTAFAGEHLVGSGGLRAMLGKVKAYLDDGGEYRVLIFEDQTGRQVDFDFRGTPEEVLDRAENYDDETLALFRADDVKRTLLEEGWKEDA